MVGSDLEVLAVRYAKMDTRRAHQYYRYSVYGDPDASMTLDYFFWVVRHRGEITLVDTGFHPDALANRPGREVYEPPVAALTNLGIDPRQVSRVIVTHFHYDHIGNLPAFANARFTVQRAEFDFWTGRHRHRPAAAASCEAAEIDFIAKAAREGRVDFVDGDADVDPDIRVRLVGGHCPGQQVVHVGSPGVLLCSDALHFYDEMMAYRPFNVFFDLNEMFVAFDLFHSYERDGVAIVAGHDPEVLRRFPALTGHDGVAVKLL